MWTSASPGGWADMAIKVWSIGVAIIFAFLIGAATEAGYNDDLTTSQIVGFILFGAWSIGVWLVSIGYSEGKRN